MNLTEALEARGIEYRVHSSKPNEIFLCCPFCVEQGTTPDTRFRLGINVVTGWMNCFNGGCGKKSRSLEYTFREIQRVLETGQLEAAMNVAKQNQQPTKKVRLPEDFQPLQMKEIKEHWHDMAYHYVRGRGVTVDQIQKKRIGFSLVGDFRYRVVIPVYAKGKLAGLVGRAFVRDLEPKYKNSMGQKVLYNVPDEKMDSAILVEGAFDALACERGIGRYYDCLGVLGHALTDRQIKQLKRYKRIILWPDPDNAGVTGFLKMARTLVMEEKKWVGIVLPKLDGSQEYDPSDLNNREIQNMVGKMVKYGPDVEDLMKSKLAFQED